MGCQYLQEVPPTGVIQEEEQVLIVLGQTDRCKLQETTTAMQADSQQGLITDTTT